MEPWPVHDDTPYLRRPPESSSAWWLVVLLVVLGVAAAGYYFLQRSEEPTALPGTPAPRAEAPPAAPETAPAIRHPIETPGNETQPLPTLENSDSMMRQALSELMGRKPFDELVYPAQLIRRIVATVDNLPRETAPRRVMPLQPVPGSLAAAATADQLIIGPANAARYAPYVRVIESLDSRTLVRRYIDSYALFQRAYEELGYPNRYYNDLLVEAIDDLLAAPEITAPIRIVQPKVLYQFEDPDLETRSAGQKIMIRMGTDNAAKVKGKLREIRRQLSAAGAARP
jgi:hypothetical protein